jgi:O-antigen/teichoic acid export membrane protein
MSIALGRGRLMQQVRRFATGGTASIAANVAATNVLRIFSSMTLTRLLDSYSYGVVGVITSIAYMLAMVSDAGFYPFIIRHTRADDPKFLDEVWTIRLVRGIILMIVMAVLAKPIAAFLGKPDLAPVIMAWSLIFLIDGLSALSFAVGVKQQKLWRISILDTATNVITLIGSVTIAFIFRSYWAMISGMLIGQCARAILSYVMFADSRRGFRVSREVRQELWRFSRYVAISSILSLIILQADKVVLARMMSLADYGFYAIATTLAVAPEAIATPYAQRVLYPIYARIARQDRSALKATYYAARRRVTLLYSLGVGALIGGAPLLIAILYDPRYRPVAPFLQLLALRVVLRMPNLAASEAFVALGQTRKPLVANIFRITWLIAGGVLAVLKGNVMMLVACVATDELGAMLFYWGSLYRERLLSLREESYGIILCCIGAIAGYGVATVGLRFFH